MISDKADLIFHAFDYRIDQRGVLEDPFTIVFGLDGVEIALKEYDFEKVQKMYLHSMILVVYNLFESSQNRVNDDMSYFV